MLSFWYTSHLEVPRACVNGTEAHQYYDERPITICELSWVEDPGRLSCLTVQDETIGSLMCSSIVLHRCVRQVKFERLSCLWRPYPLWAKVQFESRSWLHPWWQSLWYTQCSMDVCIAKRIGCVVEKLRKPFILGDSKIWGEQYMDYLESNCVSQKIEICI